MTPSLAAFLTGAGMLTTAMVITLALHGDPNVPAGVRVRVAGLATAGLITTIIGGLSYLL